jgi:hypothetical protein
MDNSNNNKLKSLIESYLFPWSALGESLGEGVLEISAFIVDELIEEIFLPTSD